ncbi:MAG: tRNA (adenosine(37)-N6)-threonylcarbamoyltransferase complex dimerization subunit type 1 TsaB [Planctomycetia bacterium]|nr:tRNA (adenosine(37)-N6)-threonylcarbamoyltransferase complex dimerization subunit type 1 TsaB [Planctomycetia bacterium]
MLETIALSAQAALFEEGRMIQKTILAPGEKSACSLAPMVERLLRENNVAPREIRVVGVVNGPGSFTGLRVGLAFAKTLAWGIGAEVVALNTLEVLAADALKHMTQNGSQNGFQNAQKISAAVDAQRNQVLAQDFACVESALSSGFESPAGFEVRKMGEMALLDFTQWAAERRDDFLLTGPALAKYGKFLPDGAQALPSECWEPSVETLGELVWERYRRGETSELMDILPIYSRLAAAEERKVVLKKKQ